MSCTNVMYYFESCIPNAHLCTERLPGLKFVRMEERIWKVARQRRYTNVVTVPLSLCLEGVDTKPPARFHRSADTPNTLFGTVFTAELVSRPRSNSASKLANLSLARSFRRIYAATQDKYHLHQEYMQQRRGSIPGDENKYCRLLQHQFLVGQVLPLMGACCAEIDRNRWSP